MNLLNITTEKNSPWTITEALTLIRHIQPILHENGWHVALGGGVLNNGFSNKDLDLYFFPFGSKDGVSTDSLKRWLGLMWGDAQDMSTYRNNKDEVFMVKEKYYPPNYPDKRIDCFIGYKKQSWWSKLVEHFNLWKYGQRTMIGSMVMDEAVYSDNYFD